MEATPTVQRATTRPAWRAVHVFIVLTLLSEALYCLVQVMVVLQPPDVTGPLFWAAADLPLDLLVRRRLYAIEGWLAAVGLALYLGVTEIRPRVG